MTPTADERLVIEMDVRSVSTTRDVNYGCFELLRIRKLARQTVFGWVIAIVVRIKCSHLYDQGLTL